MNRIFYYILVVVFFETGYSKTIKVMSGQVEISSVIDQQHIGDDLNSYFPHIGQTYTAGINGLLTQIDLRIFCLQECNNIFLDIFEVDNITGLPVGSSLGQSNLNSINVLNTINWHAFKFNLPITQIVGKKYAFILNNTFGGSLILITTSIQNPYFGGNVLLTAGISFLGSPEDVIFKTYVENGVQPVNLINFSGKVIPNNFGNIILLNWITTSEKNAESFTIERTSNFENYSKIGSIKANGNSAENIFYSFRDLNPFNGINYYRLLQYDSDGTIHYFPIIAIINEETKANNLVYLTDFGKKINIQSANNTTDFFLKSFTGQQIPIAINKISDTISEITPMVNLSIGIYLLIFESNNEIEIYKVIIQ